jgi:hypothetical protein
MTEKQYTIKSGLDNAGIKFSEDLFGTGKKEIKDVELSLESSTSRARVFNFALKLAALQWTDPTIDKLENILDYRLIEIATGKFYKVTSEKIKDKRNWTKVIKANNEDRARDMIAESYPDSKVINVELYKTEEK